MVSRCFLLILALDCFFLFMLKYPDEAGQLFTAVHSVLNCIVTTSLYLALLVPLHLRKSVQFVTRGWWTLSDVTVYCWHVLFHSGGPRILQILQQLYGTSNEVMPLVLMAISVLLLAYKVINRVNKNKEGSTISLQGSSSQESSTSSCSPAKSARPQGEESLWRKLLCRPFVRNLPQDNMQAELDVVKAAYNRLLLEKQTALKAQSARGLTMVELFFIKNKLSVLMESLTTVELQELLIAANSQRSKTLGAAKLSAAKLVIDLSTSEAALAAERHKVSLLQSQLASGHQAFASLHKDMTDTKSTVNTYERQIQTLKSAASDSQRKLAASQKTIYHLTEYGKQDRLRLLEVTSDRNRLMQLQSIAGYTCGKLRRERNDAVLELQALKSSIAQNNISINDNIINDSDIKGKWANDHVLTKSQIPDTLPAKTQPAMPTNQRESQATATYVHEPSLWIRISRVLKVVVVTVPILALCAGSLLHLVYLLYSEGQVKVIPT